MEQGKRNIVWMDERLNKKMDGQPRHGLHPSWAKIIFQEIDIKKVKQWPEVNEKGPGDPSTLKKNRLTEP